MARANSPWLTQLQYAFQDQTNLYLVMDFHPGGDLLSLLNRHDDVFEEDMARFYLAEMVLAVHSLHSMGFVHRDVKPENVLIDRTGHIKLVDFGSACRLQSTYPKASKIPVGTPDYVCPEVLMRLQNSEEQDYFDEGCDWWSLGVCAYEMLYGRTPFTGQDSGSMVVTYANIMNHKEFLTFPNGKVSQSAEDLIRSLLTDPQDRLNYEAIRSHAFFAHVDFDNMLQKCPPFIPTVRASDDTSNFDDFEKVKSVTFTTSPFNKQFGFNGKDLPFIGFTFSKQLALSTHCTHMTTESESLVSNNWRDIDDLERQVVLLKMEVEQTKKQLADSDEKLRTADETRLVVERQLSAYCAEISNLKRSLDLERKKNLAMEEKATHLLDDISFTSQQSQKLMRDDFSKQLTEQKEIREHLENENLELNKKLLKQEKHFKECLVKPLSVHFGNNGSLEELRIKIKHEFKDVYRSKVKDMCTRLKKQQQDFAAQEAVLKARNEQMVTQLFECRQRLERATADKFNLQAEVKKLELECTNTAAARQAAEERCKSLESSAARLHLLEDRERQLMRQLDEKNRYVVTMESKIAERESEIAQMKLNNTDIHNQSTMILEENEVRLQNIRQQEAVISKLKSNITTLEEQVNSLKSDLTEVRKVKHYKITKNDIPDLLEPGSSVLASATAGNACEDYTEKLLSSPDMFSYVYKRNKTHDWVPRIDIESMHRLNDEEDEWLSDSSKNETDKRKSGNFRRKSSVFVSPKHPCCRTTNAHNRSDRLGNAVHIKTATSATSLHTKPHAACNLKDSFGLSSMSESTIAGPSRHDVALVEDDLLFNVSMPSVADARQDSIGSSCSLDESFNHLVETNSDSSYRAFDLHIRARVKTRKHGASMHFNGVHKKDNMNDAAVTTPAQASDLNTNSADAGCSISSKAEDHVQKSAKLCDRSVGSFVALPRDVSTDMNDLLSFFDDTSKPDGEQQERLQKDSTYDGELKIQKAENARLVNEIEHVKDVAHEQRIRALDLKHELREKTAGLSNEVADLKFRLSKTEMELREASENLSKARENESEMRSFLEKAQRDCDAARLEAKQSEITLKTYRKDLEGQIERLSVQVETVEKTELEIRHLKDQYKFELDEANNKCCEYELQLKETSGRLNVWTDEKTQFVLNLEKANIELEETKRHSASLQQQVEQLQVVCQVLECEAQDLNKLIVQRESNSQQQSMQYESSLEAADVARKSERVKLQKEVDLANSLVAQQKMMLDTANSKILQAEHRIEMLECENKALKRHLDGSEGAKQRAITDAEWELNGALTSKNQLSLELSSVQNKLVETEKQLDRYKSLCKDLESDVSDWKKISDCEQEEKSRQIQQEKSYKLTIESLELEIKQLQSQVSCEKQMRAVCEEKVSDTATKGENIKTSFLMELDRFRVQDVEQCAHIEMLNVQLTKTEERRLQLELQNKNLCNRLTVAEQELISLKEEISKEITRNQELKASNSSLNKKLESELTRHNALVVTKLNLEGQIENIQANYQQEKYRMEETISQQAKLIDFLQDKMENTPKKKKWFIGSKPGHSASESIPGSVHLKDGYSTLQRERHRVSAESIPGSVQLRDGYNTLLRERDATRPLTLHITQPRTSEGARPERPKSEIVGGKAVSSKPCSSNPSNDVRAGIATNPAQQNRRQAAAKKSTTHHFLTGINSRATKCVVCLGSIHYVQQAAKCQDCSAICHPKCIQNLPANCGVLCEYYQYMVDALAYVRPQSTSSEHGKVVVPSAPVMQSQLSGFLKMLRPGKPTWETKYLAVFDNKLFVYNDSDAVASGIKAVDEFDLCPSNGVVSVQTAVLQTELANVLASDLPFVMMVEFEPDDGKTQNRTLYLMAKSFVEKQKWAATLETIASSNSNSSMIKDVKVFGNIICQLPAHGSNQLDVLCTWPISNEFLLIGTESGLYATQFSNDINRLPMLRLPNVDCNVYTIEGRQDIDMLLFIVGPDRNVIFCELEAMKQWLLSNNSLPPPNFTAVDSAISATVLAIERNSDGLYLCIAMTESVILYKFNNSLKAFCIRKEIPVCQPCCCLSFSKGGVIFGSDKFYVIEFNTCDVREFLDKTDSTLAFAVFGTVQYESYPIAVFSILQDRVPTGEFLICFNEFGVFVNNAGRRSRKLNIKWTGLPLMFAYKEPFLYTIHYNAIQVMEIMPRQNHSSAPVGMKTFVNVIGAQYLGPALTQGALYVASVTDVATEILCLKGIANGVAVKQQ